MTGNGALLKNLQETNKIIFEMFWLVQFRLDLLLIYGFLADWTLRIFLIFCILLSFEIGWIWTGVTFIPAELSGSGQTLQKLSKCCLFQNLYLQKITNLATLFY